MSWKRFFVMGALAALSAHLVVPAFALPAC